MNYNEFSCNLQQRSLKSIMVFLLKKSSLYPGFVTVALIASVCDYNSVYSAFVTVAFKLFVCDYGIYVCNCGVYILYSWLWHI